MTEPTPSSPASPRRSRWLLLRWTLAVLAVGFLAYGLWSPGSLRPLPADTRNGAWLTRAWWAEETWWTDSSRDRSAYDGDDDRARLAVKLHSLRIHDWYVHACPAGPDGRPPAIDDDAARALVAVNTGGQVLAWVGGVLHESCHPSEAAWRARFAAGCADLVTRTGVAGIHLNIEPCPSWEPGYLELLTELRAALPPDSRLSVAAYPPPTRWQPAPEVHWELPFITAVSERVDDMAVMAYDTGLRLAKPYTALMAAWTREVLAASACPVRIGLPAYDDAWAPWHDPQVENLTYAIPGLSAGLGESPPPTYAGWAVYAEWTMTAADEVMLGQ